jgi:hypothetical protein
MSFCNYIPALAVPHLCLDLASWNHIRIMKSCCLKLLPLQHTMETNHVLACIRVQLCIIHSYITLELFILSLSNLVCLHDFTISLDIKMQMIVLLRRYIQKVISKLMVYKEV